MVFMPLHRCLVMLCSNFLLLASFPSLNLKGSSLWTLFKHSRWVQSSPGKGMFKASLVKSWLVVRTKNWFKIKHWFRASPGTFLVEKMRICESNLCSSTNLGFPSVSWFLIKSKEPDLTLSYTVSYNPDLSCGLPVPVLVGSISLCPSLFSHAWSEHSSCSVLTWHCLPYVEHSPVPFSLAHCP